MEPASTKRAAQALAEARAHVDEALARWAAGADPVVAYTLEGPGKRLRGALTIECYAAAGGRDPAIVELAAAVEVVHAYSLVHDDLPIMDDDDLRRGRATVHRVHGVEAATRAAFAMIPLAARALALGVTTLGLDPGTYAAIAQDLIGAAGGGGMIGGQYLDLEAEGGTVTQAELEAIHGAKTGALIAAACVIGARAAGCDGPALEAFRQYGFEAGIAYQIADDLLDATATTQEIGKTAGKDAAQVKATYVGLLGAEGAAREASRRAGRAVEALRAGGISSDVLVALAAFMSDRRV